MARSGSDSAISATTNAPRIACERRVPPMVVLPLQSGGIARSVRGDRRVGADDEPGEERQPRRECHRTTVEPCLAETGEGRAERDQRLEGQRAEQNPEQGAGGGEGDALGDQEPEQPTAGCPQHCAQSDLLPRPVTRTSMRLATLAMAMSNTRPTAAEKMLSICFEFPSTAVRSG